MGGELARDNGSSDDQFAAEALSNLWNRIHTLSRLDNPEIRAPGTIWRDGGIGFEIAASNLMDALAVLDFRARGLMARFEIDRQYLRVSIVRESGLQFRVRAPLERGPKSGTIAFEYPLDRLRGWTRPVRSRLYPEGMLLYCRVVPDLKLAIVATSLRALDAASMPGRAQRKARRHGDESFLLLSVAIDIEDRALTWDEAADHGQPVPNEELEAAIAYAAPFAKPRALRSQYAHVHVGPAGVLACYEDQTALIHVDHAALNSLSLSISGQDIRMVQRALRVAKAGHTQLFRVSGYQLFFDGVLLCAVPECDWPLPIPAVLRQLPQHEIVVQRGDTISAVLDHTDVARGFGTAFAAAPSAPGPRNPTAVHSGFSNAVKQVKTVLIDAFSHHEIAQRGKNPSDIDGEFVIELRMQGDGSSARLQLSGAELEHKVTTSVPGTRSVQGLAGRQDGPVDGAEMSGAPERQDPVTASDPVAHAFCRDLHTVASVLDGDSITVGFGDRWSVFESARGDFTVRAWLMDPLAAAQQRQVSAPRAVNDRP